MVALNILFIRAPHRIPFPVILLLFSRVVVSSLDLSTCNKANPIT